MQPNPTQFLSALLNLEHAASYGGPTPWTFTIRNESNTAQIVLFPWSSGGTNPAYRSFSWHLAIWEFHIVQWTMYFLITRFSGDKQIQAPSRLVVCICSSTFSSNCLYVVSIFFNLCQGVWVTLFNSAWWFWKMCNLRRAVIVRRNLGPAPKRRPPSWLVDLN